MTPTLPNAITLFRATLIIPWLLNLDRTPVLVVIAGVALLTDWLDGFLARRSRQESDYGAKLDVISDKLFIAIALTSIFFKFNVPGTLAVIVFTREILLIAMFIYVKIRRINYSLTPRFISKGVTAIQFAFILITLLCGQWVTALAYGVGVCGTVASIDYYIHNIHRVSQI